MAKENEGPVEVRAKSRGRFGDEIREAVEGPFPETRAPTREQNGADLYGIGVTPDLFPDCSHYPDCRRTTLWRPD